MMSWMSWRGFWVLGDRGGVTLPGPSGGTETAGFVRPCSAGVLHAVAGVHAWCLLEVMPS